MIDRHEWLARMMPALLLCIPAALLYWKWWKEDQREAQKKKRHGFDVIKKGKD